jgi:RNA polymerase subunit RPABC4/transcription elongation factor Spt4
LIRPRRAELEPGQRACFRVRLLDAEDCPVPASDVSWQITHGSAQRATLNGSCFTAGETAADGEDEYRISAKRGNLQGEVNVTVRRVDLSSLIARRSEDHAANDDDDEIGFVTPKPATQIATRVAMPAEQGNRIRLALGIGLGACALLLVALGLWIRNNPRMRGQAMATPALATAAAAQTSALSPTEREPSSRVETSGSTSPKSEADDTSMQQWICPTCRVGYPAQQTTCPKDGSALVSYATFTERSKRVEQEHAKRCPTCGKTYPASASFCGEDGVSLVSVQ